MTHLAQVALLPLEAMRTAERRAVNFTAFIRETGAGISSAEVTDLSTDGCKFRSTEQFETATIVWLKMSGVGARQVRIVWYERGEYGCEFLSPIAQGMLEELIAHKKADWRRTREQTRERFQGAPGRPNQPRGGTWS